jgi:hypothetical protein
MRLYEQNLQAMQRKCVTTTFLKQEAALYFQSVADRAAQKSANMG